VSVCARVLIIKPNPSPPPLACARVPKKMSYDIKGLDKRALLKELWSRQKVAAHFEKAPAKQPKWDEKGIEKALASDIDYYNGRCIKMDLSGDTLKPNNTYYEDDAGAGAIAAAIAAVRAAAAAAAAAQKK